MPPRDTSPQQPWHGVATLGRSLVAMCGHATTVSHHWSWKPATNCRPEGQKHNNNTANDATTRYGSTTAVAWRGNAGVVPGGDVWSRYNCVTPLELKTSYKL